MKITFTGKQEPMTPAQERKLATRFGKLSKLIERRGEKDAHVVLSHERHLHRTEVRVNFYDHPLVGIGADSDQFAAIMEAVEKLEKQTVKLLERMRDTKRSGVKPPVAAAPAPVKAKPRESNRKVVRPAAKPNGKPMSAAEALLTMEEAQDYMVYHDTDTQRKSVLVRRRDGSVDVVET